MTKLLVVESPSKAKTIGKYLGKDYIVKASMGHIRSLPSKSGSIDVENKFKMQYEISARATKAVKEIAEAMKSCDELLLAPDPDREGEAIAWHIEEVLRAKKALKDKIIRRVVFNAVTKESVQEAIDNPRELDMNLVNAQQSRLALDYLVGFTLSPVLWRKLPGSKSAGRVQSVALRIICDREKEVSSFIPEEFWTIDVSLLNENNKKINAKLALVENKKLEKFSIAKEEQARDIEKILLQKKYIVSSIEKKQSKRNPYAPFTTSTLQQEAARKLGFSSKKTMTVAQKLYEGIDVGNGVEGLITYMRTDGVYTDPAAVKVARDVIKSQYGDRYLPKSPIEYKNKIKNSQEAHEAIRPTNIKHIPEDIKSKMEPDLFRLYELIWKRLIASQMNPVILDQVAININTQSPYGSLRANGSVINFDGFYVLYNEDSDEEEEKEDGILPSVKEGEELKLEEINANQHFTSPPPRFSEASLVKKMEEMGIGRPSTYASIISVIQDRGYVKIDKKRFIPESRGMVVTEFLKKYFSRYVEYDYTANLEDKLDEISNGDANWIKFLSEFWKDFNIQTTEGLKIPPLDVTNYINEALGSFVFKKKDNGELKNECPSCDNGKLEIRLGKYGAFISCSNYPECKHVSQLTGEDDEHLDENLTEIGAQKFDTKILGEFENKNIYLKKGPYGFYMQLGEDGDKKNKPKRVALAKGKNPLDITLEDALKMISLPRLVGIHPEGGEIRSNIGPYGPYIIYNKEFFSLGKDYDIFEISAEDSLKVIEIKKSKPKTTRGVKKTTLKKKK